MAWISRRRLILLLRMLGLVILHVSSEIKDIRSPDGSGCVMNVAVKDTSAMVEQPFCSNNEPYPLAEEPERANSPRTMITRELLSWQPSYNPDIRCQMQQQYSNTVTSSDEFTVIVESADKPKGACQAVIHVHLIEDDKVGEEEELSVVEFPTEMERGHKNIFTIKEPRVQSVTGIGIRGDMMVGSAGWNIDKLKVINNRNGLEKVIPIFTRIKAGKTYTFLVNDVALPQICSNKADDRQENLAEMRALYQITEEKIPGGPPLVKRLPPEEEFSFCYKLQIGLKLKRYQADATVRQLLSGEFENISDIQKVYHSPLNVFPEPSNLDRWRDDVLFGMQRLMGVNSNVISLCTEVPNKLTVSSETLEPFLEKKSLSEALTEKRIFIVDYEILNDISTKPGFVMTAPIALFYQRADGFIVPIAIQLFQEPGHHNPVFLPSDDKNTWILAKMWFNLADANYHQSITHLGFTHLKMEGIAACTHRQIHKTHPIFKLLMPHFLYLLAINSFSFPVLLDRGKYIDELFNLGSDGVKKLIARTNKMWRMDVEGTLPSNLKQRGVYDKTLLPHYYYRDDAIELYNAIHLYVEKYLDIYYASDKDVEEDYELQQWRKELVAPVKNRGLDMKGVFGEHDKFNSKKQICLTLTSIIYTCSVQHAAVNFRQYEEYAYPPNYPLCLRGVPPNSKVPLDEQRLLRSLPDKIRTYDTMVITLVLSSRISNKLGDFEVQYITDERALKVVNEFKEDLIRIAERNVKKNKRRFEPYTCLNPKLVPNSISI